MLKGMALVVVNAFRALLSIVCVVLVAQASLANSIDAHDFESEQQRDRYLKLVQELRCPMCQNQNILDSNSQISIDLRNQVAKLVKQNQSDEQVKEYMVNRYSEFVLYDPPLDINTLLLWYGPFVMFGLGVLVFFLSVAKRRKNTQLADAEADDKAVD